MQKEGSTLLEYLESVSMTVCSALFAGIESHKALTRGRCELFSCGTAPGPKAALDVTEGNAIRGHPFSDNGLLCGRVCVWSVWKLQWRDWIFWNVIWQHPPLSSSMIWGVFGVMDQLANIFQFLSKLTLGSRCFSQTNRMRWRFPRPLQRPERRRKSSWWLRSAAWRRCPTGPASTAASLASASKPTRRIYCRR